MESPTRFVFAGFDVSRRERQLRRGGVVLPLIPRYFDLLVLLIERRPGVVTRREIFDVVWGDVIVSDGALSQAVRTLRRTLGDQTRQPVFIRTVSRHGYSFVYGDVREEPDLGPRSTAAEALAAWPDANGLPAVDERIRTLVSALVAGTSPDAASLEEPRDAAQQLHLLGTAPALEALAAHPRHAAALALMRDTRWDVPGAGPVPLWGRPGGLAAARFLMRLRAREALAVIRRRWLRAASGGGAAGLLAGFAGGLLLWLAPASDAPPTALAVLAVLGAVAGLVAAAPVAAGMIAAEAVARSRRALAIVAGGAAGGLGVGALGGAIVEWTLAAVFGLPVNLGGALDGLLLGGSVAAGYAVATPRPQGGIAALAGGSRAKALLMTAASGAAMAVALALAGRPLVGGTIHAVAMASQGSQMALTPLGALLGEPAFGPVAQALVAAFEGGMFGLGLAWGFSSSARPD